MLAVLDGPVAAGVGGQVAGTGQVRGQAGDAVGDLLVRPRAAGGARVAADTQDLGGVRPIDAIGRGGADGPPLAAAVPCALFGPGGVREAGVGAGQGLGCGLQQGRLVALDDHQIVRVLIPGQVAGGFRLGVQCVQRDYLPGEVQVRDRRGQFRDLVGLGVDFPLGAHAPRGHVQHRQQVDLAAISADRGPSYRPRRSAPAGRAPPAGRPPRRRGAARARAGSRQAGRAAGWQASRSGSRTAPR